jgi:hypothetical protein
MEVPPQIVHMQGSPRQQRDRVAMREQFPGVCEAEFHLVKILRLAPF